MWSEKKIGVRQHHCRSCGKALCEKCSKLRTTIPEQGFEFIPVRCCLGCYESITDSDRIPFATSHQLPTDVSTNKGEFYFRWLENTVVDIGKAASISLMFHLLY